MRNTGYKKLEYLGQGSYGKVYKVKSNSTGEECVMKEISAKKTDQTMFQNEVALMEKINNLSSPYLVKYIESYVREEESEYVIIMEYCSGGSLEDIIEQYKKKERISEDTILKFMKQILLGVMVLHKNKILHRDLKPGNILVDSKGNLKLSDFGISKQLSGPVPYAQTARGTLCYSSLEVLKGEKYNFCADIWSLGCILHELCCLEPPCTKENIFIFVQWWEEKRYDVNVIPKSYSKEIKDLVVSTLNYDRKLRPTCEVLLSNELFAEISVEENKVHHLKNGDKYEGELKDGKPHGKGIYYYANGDKYEGEYKDNKRNGKGVYYYANGNRYEGEYKDDKRNNKGILYYANGSKYEGEYKDDEINGKGIFYYTNGDRYEGEYKDGKMSGKGIFYKANGDRYEGEYKGDEKNGKGIYYCANGNRYEGEYKDNKKKW